ncbi:GEVED domain-containing protein [Psychroserpens damuponensis]|uniref:GEVED domain-containing protein n=1 Tax=Psychroserpens damuponensis TaxID=943936 RepID=UPI00069349CA|nr:GEVED domain-containing protein [Psychroserpens damuponensis]
MKKNYSLIFIAFLCAILSGFGQVPTTIDFETNLSGYSHTPSQLPSADPGDQYFHRAMPGDGTIYESGGTYTNVTGNWMFVGSNPKAFNSGNSGVLTLDPINITGYSNLELSIDFGGVPNDWDASDEITVEYRYDSTGTWSTLYSLSSPVTNDPLELSGNAIGGVNTANGLVLTYALQTITTDNFTGTGTNLNIRIVCNSNANYEAFGLDNIVLDGTSSCTPPLDPTGTISGTTPACDNTTLTYTGAALPGTVNYWQTTATGTSTANNATGTFNATATGTYYVRTFLTATSCWSTGVASYAVVINSAPTISAQPANAIRVIPNTATFSVTASGSPTPTYQWQVSTNGGGTWANVTGGTGATTNSYTTGATAAAMHNNQYRCVVTNTCGTVNSNAATLTLSNTPTSNVTSAEGCFDDDSVILSWNAPGTGTPTGYMIFALDGGTDPAGTKTDANTYTANSDFSAATPVTPASLGRVVYKGTATTATITGLIEDNNYSFTVYSYVGEALTGWSGGGTGGSTVTNETAQGDVSNLAATPLTNQVNLSWNNPLPTSCFDQLIIVANEGAVVFTPSGTYPNTDVNYSGPNSIMYATTSTISSKGLSGLTNGTNYCFKVFIRRGSNWSEGVEVCAVPSLTYCPSSGDGTDGYETGIRRVQFNTIDNTTPIEDNDYSNFTSISTTVNLGDSYDLTVSVNTDGDYTNYNRAWIDWNQNGNFNDSGEEYDLGLADDPSGTNPSVVTDNSPLSIEIPTNAAIGATRMRVASKYNNYSTSCENGFDGEVEDYTVIVQQPSGAEINVKGNNITIANGFNAPYGLNNTLFGAQDVSTTSAFKSYFVENIGATTLNLTGAPRVEIIGAHPGDFNVVQQPAATIGSLADSEFRIVFSPTADGTRTATVRILNSDSDENTYEFDIQGNAVCSTVLTSSMWPTEGPENTEVTITSANDLTGATATINGDAMTIVSTSASELVVLVPAGAISGSLEVLFSTGCSSSNSFTVIDSVIGGCETAAVSTVPSDLFISEISDASTGSSSLLEIFNGTASTINLANYSIRVFNNGNATPSTTSFLVGSLAPGELHVISIGTTSCDLSATGLASGLPDQSFNSAGGINFDNNSSDAIQLFNGGTPIDSFGEIGSSTWANGLGINGDGVNYRRQNTAATLPTTTFDITEWDEFDWTSCGDSDYSNFGLYDFSLGVPPTVSILSDPTFSCATSTSLSITATEGVPSGFGLVYQWYYLAPNATAFVVVPNNADFNNVTTDTLEIVNNLAYNEYQFYCQVRENTATCYTASNAVKLVADGAVWDGTNWSTPPTIDKIAIINGDYNTSIGTNGQTSFEACQLIVNPTYTLDIANNTFVKVQNNVTVNGNIVVSTDGSFVQVDDLAIVNGDVLSTRNKIMVEKETAPMATYQEYTYWSSPVFGELLNDGLSEASTTRRFWYNAQNYLDATQENMNDDATNAGQDDIDDNADDWITATGTDPMLPGVGYASTHNSIGFMPAQYIYVFEGPFNNGVINVPIYRNDSETNDNNWNFIGNPYPSAIDADAFLATNTSIDQNVNGTDGAIYFWSHNTAADGDTNGNENLNYTQSDYAIINGTGQNAGGDGVVPTRHIPSGQGFFVSMSDASTSTAVSGSIRTTDVVFNNSMRVTGNNDQFFRTSNIVQYNKIRLDLTSDNGIFNQILVGYVNGATNNDDGMYYDAKRNLSNNASSLLYSLINHTSDIKLAIQGKEVNSLTLEEVIPLGFYTSIDEATLYKLSIAELEGDFMNENTVYLKDKLMNITHNLSANDYTFTSEIGEFNNRFDIVFQPETLSVNEQELTPNDLTIIELGSGEVRFSVEKNITINTVEIIDVLGRTIYKLSGQNSTETYNLSNLSQATYIARVTLSNGQVITKKAIKRN